jgi:hypothetical protein
LARWTFCTAIFICGECGKFSRLTFVAKALSVYSYGGRVLTFFAILTGIGGCLKRMIGILSCTARLTGGLVGAGVKPSRTSRAIIFAKGTDFTTGARFTVFRCVHECSSITLGAVSSTNRRRFFGCTIGTIGLTTSVGESANGTLDTDQCFVHVSSRFALGTIRLTFVV